MSKKAKEHLEKIFRAGLAAADPAAAVKRCLKIRRNGLIVGEKTYPLNGVNRILVAGAGKASVAMAGAVEDVLGDMIAGGWVNTKAGDSQKLRRIHVHQAGHPVPDEDGAHGAQEILRIFRNACRGDLIIFCLSGGASALLPLPSDGITLEDKQKVTRELLACGADIREMNCVRKHLSAVKGGQLARAAQPAQLITLILSDVIGDPLDSIGSGPTAPDSTTFADAMNVIKRYGIAARLPKGVMKRLKDGVAGRLPDTPKRNDPVFRRVKNILVANNSIAVEACAAEAKKLGYAPLVLTTRMEGEAREVARALVAIGREALSNGRPVKPPACLICGGETTVTLRGKGKGGRNQELALAAAIAGRGVAGWSLLAAGTDGTDGPTDAAGAVADGETTARGVRKGLSAFEALRENDSYNFFRPLGDLIKTGPTGTNVMDLYLLLLTQENADCRVQNAE